MVPTHSVTNQAPPLEDHHPWRIDRSLKLAVAREGAEWAFPSLDQLSQRIGSPEVIRWGVEANENPPVLHTHDRYGRRIDEVRFHASYHQLMALSVESGLHAGPWADERAGAHVARAAGFYLAAQNELGHGCPISMTYSVVPALKHQPDVAAEWLPRITARKYDPRFLPAADKSGVLFGMAMTEKQGGSDVRANTTRAVDAGDGTWRITGHKWFCSAPMCDAFLMLAQTATGLSCFLGPRWLPDGTLNRFFIQRLKNKLGNKSNASSEIELSDTVGWKVGEEGRGVPTILDMATHTRLDCVIGSSGMMRQALVLAMHHAKHRAAFGRPLIAQPAMQAVLADLALESEAATQFMVRLAAAYDRNTPDAVAFRRIATPIGKYYVCKRAIAHVAEAMECLGGAGYVEDFPFARLHRETPLYSVWEGSGNVIALDVLRALHRQPATAEVLFAEIREAKGNATLDAFVDDLQRALAEASQDEGQARWLVDALARALQASLVVRFSSSEMSDAFLATRLHGGSGTFGALPAAVDRRAILGQVWEE